MGANSFGHNVTKTVIDVHCYYCTPKKGNIFDLMFSFCSQFYFRTMDSIDIKYEYNPWEATSLYDFSYFCCPECDNKSQTKQDFVDHTANCHAWVRWFQMLSEQVSSLLTWNSRKMKNFQNYDRFAYFWMLEWAWSNLRAILNSRSQWLELLVRIRLIQ